MTYLPIQKYLARLACAWLVLGNPAPGQALGIPEAIEALHKDIWQRFVSTNGLLLDYAKVGGGIEMPTAEDCQLSKPNAVSWWTPVENGAFFTGIYLPAMVQRAALTGVAADQENARRLAAGLLSCASVGTTPGFVARFVLPDGHSHYPMGSDDQTGPWFSGLWAYVQSGIPTASERSAIVSKMLEVGNALKASHWRMPCDPEGDVKPGQYRGEFSGPDFRGASRLLFVTRILAELTRDPAWMSDYSTALREKPEGTGMTRLEIVAAGMPADAQRDPSLANQQLWIFVNSQTMLRELLHLEADPQLQQAYRQGLHANSTFATPIALKAPAPLDLQGTPFNTDWKALNKIWQPQSTPTEATKLALQQLKLWRNQGRSQEIKGLREPACASLILFLSPERSEQATTARQSLTTLIDGAKWKELSSSFEIFAEAAWLQMQADGEQR